MAATLAYCACVLAVAAAADVQHVGSAESCQAPCVRLAECAWLADMVRSIPRPPGAMQLLQWLVCGRDGEYIRVCCGPPPRPEGTTTGDEDPTKHHNLQLLPLETCGKDEPERLINGNLTVVSELTWMALLGYSTAPGGSPEFLCGGALITSRYVLTAAQCVDGRRLHHRKLVSVRLGEWDQRTDEDCDYEDFDRAWCAPKPQDFAVEEVILHPAYDPQDKLNDIALLRLDHEAPVDSQSIRPVCLPIDPESQQSYVDKRLSIAGWGTAGEPTPVKLSNPVPEVDLQTCQQQYARWNRSIAPSQMCVGGSEAYESCAAADVGGPLITYGGKRGYSRGITYDARSGWPRGKILGVMSFGPRVCDNAHPAVYTRISSFLTWILDNIRP